MPPGSLLETYGYSSFIFYSSIIIMHDSSDSPSPGCFNLRRRHSTDVIREEPSLKSDVADDYMAMKQELIARPPLSAEKTEKKLHFTERDLRTDFCTGRIENMLSNELVSQMYRHPVK